MRLGFKPINTVFTLSLIFISFSFASATAVDSVGVERTGDKSFILHEVEPKETLFGISRRYQTPVGDIINSNASLKEGLKIGQTIKVPFIPKDEIPVGAELHKVVPGETLFSISKAYNVSVEELKNWNELKGNDLSIGQALIIKGVAEPEEVLEPVAKPSSQETQEVEAPKPSIATTTAVIEKDAPTKKEIKAEAKAQEEVKNEAEDSPRPEATRPSSEAMTEATEENPMVPGDWVSHTVTSGETLFSIANQYNARVEDLITWNALSSNNLKDGQVLKIGRGPAEESKVPVYGTPKVVSSVDEMNMELENTASSGGFKNIKENGQAELIEGTGGHKKYLVLHRTAPVGTIMRIKNEENDVTIFARVVGVLPETGDNGKLIIKLSQAAFDQLKAVNGRFPVEVMY